ncbi:MAG: hypothetical protein Q9163_004628 [Psora crenata]
MASHVVVLDSSARRATVKTTPDKHLTDILHEACQKLGRNADSYGLKHNNKNLDLSRNVRLAGLSSGAKLDLVLSSRSPSAVSVALQLPEPDVKGSSRLTDTFPSNTTLWMVLRKFESSGEGVKYNFTARGVPVQNEQGNGSGRLYFETPIIQIMGRELSSFTDLQKSLVQLGYNSGSVLLRLTFRRTATLLEEAMSEIEQYFSEVESQNIKSSHGDTAAQAEPNLGIKDPVKTPGVVDAPAPAEPISPAVQSMSQKPSAPEPRLEPDVLDSANGESHLNIQRLVTVFAPPSSGVPKAAQQAFNEKDYEPTIDHAKIHQSRLAADGANKRLLSDTELSAQAAARAQRILDVKEVEIKVRFPDQMQAVAKFTSADTAKALYDFVRSLMIRENEPFSLRFSAASGPKIVPREPQDDVKLISGLGMAGRVLVNVVWENGASTEARRSNVLKEQYRQKAQEIVVEQIDTITADKEAQAPAKEVEKVGRERRGGVPKWLKLPGKK